MLCLCLAEDCECDGRLRSLLSDRKHAFIMDWHQSHHLHVLVSFSAYVHPVPEVREADVCVCVCFSAGAAVLAGCEGQRAGVGLQPLPPALSPQLQHHQCPVLLLTGPAFAHPLLQDLQGSPAGHPEV